MEVSIAVNIVSISFFAAIVFTGFLRTLAKRYNILIDLPDKNRKFHQRATPLVGGLGIHLAMLFGLFILFFSVNTKIYDRENNLQAINSNIEIIGDDLQNAFNVSASQLTNQKNAEKSIFEINIEGVDTPLRIARNSDNNFEVITPSGELKVFSLKDGKLTDLDEKRVLTIKEPEESKYFSINSGMLSIVIFGIFLQLLMLIDDIWGMTQTKRLIIQSASSLGVIILSGEYITNLGFQILNWDGQLGTFGIFFTIFAVTGLINAFNMIDGINGLCSGITLIVFLCLSLLGTDTAMSYGTVIIISSLSGFLVYNLGFFGKKRAVFLGDNGSNFLGFITAWSCITYSSNDVGLINPVTALWLVAIPVWDCIAMIFHRFASGKAATEADRDHIHHILFDRTPMKGSMPLIFLLGTSLFFALIGILIEEIFSPLLSCLLFIFLGLLFIQIKKRINFMAYSQR